MKATKIVLITSGQPSTNPRLVKEADALTEAGYSVTVIYQYYNEWATALDHEFLKVKKWEAICVGGNPMTEKAIYFSSLTKYKIAKKLINLKCISAKLSLLAIGRGTCTMIKKAKKVKADLYIAHNLAALPAAVIAAKKNQSKCGFDAEDFHRNEVSNDSRDVDVKLKTYIEDNFLPQIDYLTTSSDQISSAYQFLYPKLKATTVLNVFPFENLQAKENRNGEGLKLFWFSQTIGNGRGLEDVIKAVAELNQLNIELHLLGKSDFTTKAYFKKIASDYGLDETKIVFHNPIAANKIINFASSFDVGLATEIGDPLNRNLCLTNKLFTYLNAGLAIICSETAAQKLFLEKYQGIGNSYPIGNVEGLKSIISQYYTNKSLLANHQLKAITLAKEELNWDNEKLKFIALIKLNLDKTN